MTEKKNAKPNSVTHRQFCGDVIMKKEYKQDPYGYLLERHYHKKQEKCFIRRNDGQIDEIDLNLYFELNTEKELLFKPNIYKYIKSPILDVGCGTGRVAKNFQELGYKVVGIDISKGTISYETLMPTS